ncbi:MAG TPA: PHP domain-containing protein [Methanospirillum sp.]|nr:PHP domain-containing protein [Methanospirillum sp.]
MHLHTRYSDGRTRIPELLSYAQKNQIGVAITDHNEIRGALEAVRSQKNCLIIPGIELETREGPHLLIYFSSAGDLEGYYHDLQREWRKENPDHIQKLSVSECLIRAEEYHCLRIAAHPFGYFGINRGVLKCVEKQMLPGVLDHIDGIEVICGGMTQNLNMRAIQYADDHLIPFTGGSDAHLLSDVGSVLTGAPADTAEEFLESLRNRENVVVGKPSSYIRKGATAGVIAWSFVPYTGSLIGSQVKARKRRIDRIVSRYLKRTSARQDDQKNEENCSEEWGE